MKSCQNCHESIWLTLIRFETILKYHWKYIQFEPEGPLGSKCHCVNLFIYIYKYIIDAKEERTKVIEM